MNGMSGELAKKVIDKVPPWVVVLMFLLAPSGAGFFSGWFGKEQKINSRIAELQLRLNAAENNIDHVKADHQRFEKEGRLRTPAENELAMMRLLSEFKDDVRREIVRTMREFK